jgi:cell division protein DivIC
MQERYHYKYVSVPKARTPSPPSGRFWQTLTHFSKLIVFGTLTLLVVSLYAPLIQKVQELQGRREALQREIAREEEKTQALQFVFRLLKTDPGFVERMARDRLNMGKPGETIFRFESYPSETLSLLPLPMDAGPPVGSDAEEPMNSLGVGKPANRR